jgi:hypothetical protein
MEPQKGARQQGSPAYWPAIVTSPATIKRYRLYIIGGRNQRQVEAVLEQLQRDSVFRIGDKLHVNQ